MSSEHEGSHSYYATARTQLPSTVVRVWEEFTEEVVPCEIETFDLGTLPKTLTKITMNIAVPEGALAHAKKADGVGLLRIEFVYGNNVGIHPAALLYYNELRQDPERFLRAPPKTKDIQYFKRIIATIDARTQGYEDKTQFLVEKLREGIAIVAAAIDPEPVIVRFSDFKSNEYAALIGGEIFEKEENNPMLGWRGASRYATRPSQHHPNDPIRPNRRGSESRLGADEDRGT